jgi:hypothetical protein
MAKEINFFELVLKDPMELENVEAASAHLEALRKARVPQEAPKTQKAKIKTPEVTDEMVEKFAEKQGISVEEARLAMAQAIRALKSVGG